ncbi:LapA family protein [Yinghuangia seranimata]|uniref:LapA family protein n=1 Tax=Yinghuangia seranimata TaxID=408067 RepID=UPI00248C6D10|nr:LapA family protein [Yinghuangia seranimata]MDI2131805.1 LapA family protein [Yinghuangia seranimata]
MSNTSKSGGSGGFLSQISNTTWIAIAVGILTLWFVLANTGSASVRFWIPTVEAPMWIVLIGTFAVGAFTGWMISRRRER